MHFYSIYAPEMAMFKSQNKWQQLNWLSCQNHMHVYRPWQKSLQSFTLIGIKLYEELRTQGTHHLSSYA